MGKAIPSQQPAVVLRSQFDQLHALLAIALVAGIGLTIAVVILSRDSGDVSSTSSAKPIESINYGDSRFVNPSTGYPSVPLPQLERPLQNSVGGTRYDGGREEGTRGIAPGLEPSDRSEGNWAHGPLPPAAPAKEQSTSSESQYGRGSYRFGRP
jgi:hypothetical protein